MHFYTSININYLPKARILAKSVKDHCPTSRFSLVFSDEWPKELPKNQEPFDDIILIEDLGIPVKNLSLWIFEHTVVELCTAVKGQALVNFLQGGSEKVVYLDPDIVVFDSLNKVEELLERHDVILTPHQTEPEKNEIDIIHNEICSLQHGAYNFGFYAIRNSENGLKFARWWRDRLLDYCYDNIPAGLFTDQKWGDIVPAMFDGVYILREPGFNVSTWNLSNRKVTKTKDNLILVNGQPLQFYHFSGFDSGAQEQMLKMYGGDNPILKGLRAWYIKRQKEEGQDTYGQAKSKYNYYDNLIAIKKSQRILLRTREDLLDYFRETNPYVVEQDRSYYKWYLTEGCKQDSETSQLEKIYNSRSWKLACFLSNGFHRVKRLLFHDCI